MSNKSAAALLQVVGSHVAGDVIKFNLRRKEFDRKNNRSIGRINVSTGSRERPDAVVIDSNMTPLEASVVLWENNIMGAPVYDTESKTFIGMFDVRDILSCVIAAQREYKLISNGDDHHNPGEDTHMVSDVDVHADEQNSRRELIAKALQLMKINSKAPHPGAITVSYLAARNPLAQCTKDSSLYDVCRVLASRHQHRVIITDETPSSAKTCIGIISQSGLVSFIAGKCPPGSLDVKMVDAGLQYKKDVIQIDSVSSASDAFELIDSNRLSGIAVVDEDGKLVGNTSATDIKHAIMAGKTNMDTDILSYLAHVRQTSVMQNDKYPSCHVHEDATIAHIVSLLSKTGYHRVFVVDENMALVGVISFADIIKFFLENGNK